MPLVGQTFSVPTKGRAALQTVARKMRRRTIRSLWHAPYGHSRMRMERLLR